ncbi:hypothetical protein MTR_3g112140 [Medicago truncatula]|uniref:Uncharacterized protein n=1 Tax=Medicago truncatula TaxID=3880 RepID=A0A072V2U9_MEDTR|nr:hypothetical protein MTR_3g112140 [Medicago truncatula]
MDNGLGRVSSFFSPLNFSLGVPLVNSILADYLKYSHIDDPHDVSFTNHCHLKQYLLQIDINFIAFCLHLEQRSFADVRVSAIQECISYANTSQQKAESQNKQTTNSTEACQCKERKNLEVKS